MPTQSANKNLHQAKNAKKDEFYTQLADIENELKHYRHHFKNKVVYCNCDDPRMSNFFHYFSYNFEDLGLKKLITTCYQNQNRDLFSQHNSDQPFIWNTMATKTAIEYQTLTKLAYNTLRAMAILGVPRV